MRTAPLMIVFFCSCVLLLVAGCTPPVSGNGFSATTTPAGTTVPPLSDTSPADASEPTKNAAPAAQSAESDTPPPQVPENNAKAAVDVTADDATTDNTNTPNDPTAEDDPQEKGELPSEAYASSGSRKHWGVKQIPSVKNSIFNTKVPVLFDSGYEEDNSSCMVCHADFAMEQISSIHMEAGMTCMACHGDSEVHRADEYNIIRPDVIWGRAEMMPFCKQCHPKHKDLSKVKEFLAQWNSKRRENGRWVTEDSVCTDCHGKHAIVTQKEGDFK